LVLAVLVWAEAVLTALTLCFLLLLQLAAVQAGFNQVVLEPLAVLVGVVLQMQVRGVQLHQQVKVMRVE
jgi:hypothetical protein